MRSIRTRLLVGLIASVLVTTVVVGVMTARLTWSGFNHVRDMGLEQIAQTVMRHDETAPEPPRVPIASHNLKIDDLDQFVSQIWDHNGRLVYSSLEDVGPPLQSAGHHIATWKRESWRIYTLEHDRSIVQVAVTTKIRRRHFYSLTPWLLVPLALLVITLGLLASAVVSRALRPLENLRHDISQQSPERLQAVHTTGLTEEIAPLATTVNQLLERVERLLNHQKRFLADVAHEINTPLAAVKLQAQLARRAPEGERSAALDELDAGIERAARLASQLLQLARLEPGAHRPRVATVALGNLLRQSVAAWSVRAEHLGSDLGLLDTEAVNVTGDPHTLRTLVDNLIDNALNHAHRPVRVDVGLRIGPNTAILEISDNGPGIAPEQRQRVMERFVRLSPGDGRGSGLGLAIVREIAEQHGARVDLDETPGGGLRVRVSFPLSAGVVIHPGAHGIH